MSIQSFAVNLARDSTVQAESFEIVHSDGNKSVIDGNVKTCVLVKRTPNTSWLFSLSRINWVTDIQLRFVAGIYCMCRYVGNRTYVLCIYASIIVINYVQPKYNL